MAKIIVEILWNALIAGNLFIKRTIVKQTMIWKTNNIHQKQPFSQFYIQLEFLRKSLINTLIAKNILFFYIMCLYFSQFGNYFVLVKIYILPSSIILLDSYELLFLCLFFLLFYLPSLCFFYFFSFFSFFYFFYFFIALFLTV